MPIIRPRRRFPQTAVYSIVAGGGSFTPSSTQSANYLTRVAAVTGTGSPTYGLSNNELHAVDTFITGLVSDLGGNTASAVWPVLDAMYVLATKNTPVAALNVVANTYTLVQHGITNAQFTADVGYTGAASGYIDTTFDPTSANTNFSQNSASIFAYTPTVFTGGVDYGSLGATGSSGAQNRLYPHYSDDSAYLQVISTSTFSVNSVGAHFLGANRPNSTHFATVVDTSIVYSAFNSSTRTGTSMLLLADTTGGLNSYQGNASIYIIGGGMTNTQVLSVRSRVATYMASIP